MVVVAVSIVWDQWLLEHLFLLVFPQAFELIWIGTERQRPVIHTMPELVQKRFASTVLKIRVLQHQEHVLHLLDLFWERQVRKVGSLEYLNW